MKRILGILICISIGGVFAYYVQPYIGNNTDVVLIVATVFSVFAGFLIATIAIIGDPIMIHEGSWRIAEAGRDDMRGRLLWHISLLFVYLVTLALLFVGVVLEKALDSHDRIKIFVEWGYLFFGITSFLFTFALPIALFRMQQARYDAEIERRRNEAGIKRNASDTVN
jgi:hypothetical protein